MFGRLSGLERFDRKNDEDALVSLYTAKARSCCGVLLTPYIFQYERLMFFWEGARKCSVTKSNGAVLSVGMFLKR